MHLCFFQALTKYTFSIVHFYFRSLFSSKISNDSFRIKNYIEKVTVLVLLIQSLPPLLANQDESNHKHPTRIVGGSRPLHLRAAPPLSAQHHFGDNKEIASYKVCLPPRQSRYKSNHKHPTRIIGGSRPLHLRAAPPLFAQHHFSATTNNK